MYKILLLIIIIIIIIKNVSKVSCFQKNIEYFKIKKKKKKGKKLYKNKKKKVKKIKKKLKKYDIDLDDYLEDMDDDYYIENRMKPLPFRNKDYNENNQINEIKYIDNNNYGFLKDNNLDINNSSININFRKIFFYSSIAIFILIIVLTLFLSGYIAWNEFYNDPIYIKIIKTWLAILFCPMYLMYIFSKSIIFNLNTNTMMK